MNLLEIMLRACLCKDERRLIYSKLHPMDLEILRVAYNPKYNPKIDWVYVAHNFELIKWLYPFAWHENSLKIILIAAEFGYLEILQWCYSQCKTINRVQIYYTAARHGQIEILQWLLSQIQKNNDVYYVCNEAIRHGHISIVKWFHSIGSVDMEYWIHYYGFARSPDSIKWAADHGYEIMRL